ncbi:signal peptidase I [Agarivorans sp. MS3-6]
MEWKPKIWIVIVLGTVTQPLVFLYLNKGKLFFLYAALTAFTGVTDWYYGSHWGLSFVLICPAHGCWIAKYSKRVLVRSWYSRWWGLVAVNMLVLSSITLCRAFVIEPFTIPSASMSPSLTVGDFIVVKKAGYGTYGAFGLSFLNGDIDDSALMRRGNIYVFYPPNIQNPFVFRLMGLPGDTVSINGSDIIINGTPLETTLIASSFESRVYEETQGNYSYSIKRNLGNRLPVEREFTVPDKSYFFVGDNRDNAYDSRFFGVVTSDRIIGEVAYVMKPTKPL